ncbi:Crp/Fnr family transcriptional regulator [Gaetbulibacter aestuarii]|uniref:Crp/Fnr family transcriptional regulator n=1 Tax=Gaetbulibacter aestuarii TaxID=1502358 RepID=A0ABW7N223_9FLAO
MDSKDLHYNYSLELLAKNPIFKNLDEATLESLLSGFSYKKWEKNTEFFHGDQTLYKFYIVLSGRLKMYQVDVEQGREFTVFLLKQNDLFDVISLMDGHKHSMNIETIDDCELLCAPMHLMRHWIEEHPEINKTLLPYVASRMRILETNLTDNVLSDIPTRLAKLMLSYVDEQSHKLKLINDLSHDEIANMIGSTRAVVNRHIQSFKKSGILDIHRKNTDILDLHLLEERVTDRR